MTPVEPQTWSTSSTTTLYYVGVLIDAEELTEWPESDEDDDA